MEALARFTHFQIIVLSLLLTIFQGNGLSAAEFLTLNAATILLLCTLYTTFLYFLHRKRIRDGLYDAISPDA